MIGSKFLGGFLLGAAAGAALALFLNSDEGKEMMGDIKDAASDAGGKLKTHLNDFEDEMEGLLKKGKNFLEKLEKKAEGSFNQN